jgi:hypothetical protein
VIFLFLQFSLLSFQFLQLFEGGLKGRLIAIPLFLKDFKHILSGNHLLLLLAFQLHDVSIYQVVQLIIELFN